MRPIDYTKVTVENGFWKIKQDMVKRVTIDSVYERFKETHRFEALDCTWQEGDPDMPHIFWDSDVAKWMEGVSTLLPYEGCEKHEQIIEEVIDKFIAKQDENGYFNSHFFVADKDKIFQIRNNHELYCAGHWIEAAVAYYKATGKDRLLKAVCKFADHIEKVFKIEKSAPYITPGHPEIELALIKLYDVTGEKRYLDLAVYFIDEHGIHDTDRDLYPKWTLDPYNQDGVPLKERTTIDGHCVRALYLLSGAADVAEQNGDKELISLCKRLFDNCVNKRMYITGGVGSTYRGESFTVDYHLPNRTAYAETCAAIALAMFANRMQKLDENAKYADVVERVIYNGFLSGISMDGRSFFYENPLEITPEYNNINVSTKCKARYPITQRVEVFWCSCCPPNVMRFIGSIGGYAFAENEDTFFVNQYTTSTAENIKVETNYPADGNIKITYSGQKKLAVRIPAWCKSFKVNCAYTLNNGYAYLEGKDIELKLDMPVRVIAANRKVYDNSGRVAVMRGPVVYCAEGVDNGADINGVAIDPKGAFSLADGKFLLPDLETTGYRPKESDELYFDCNEDYEEFKLTLIPYYAFANRGESDMQVWLLKK